MYFLLKEKLIELLVRDVHSKDGLSLGVPTVVQWVKDLVLSQLWCRSQLQLRFNPWPRGRPYAEGCSQKNKNKKKGWSIPGILVTTIWTPELCWSCWPCGQILGSVWVYLFWAINFISWNYFSLIAVLIRFSYTQLRRQNSYAFKQERSFFLSRLKEGRRWKVQSYMSAP